MDNTQNSFMRLHEVITKGNSGAIVLPANPSYDAIAATTSLYLGLTKTGKNISLVCETALQNDLTAADKIQVNLVTGGDSLVISFPYTDGSIDKVDYNIQGTFFNLVITPRPGAPKLDPTQVKHSYTGGILDFIIVADSPTLNSLGTIYSDNQTQFQGKDIINIDRHLTNSFYGTINLVNKTSSSVSELIFSILQNLQVEIDRDMATNLYAGIAAATNNFTSYSVNADTFEHIAALLRLGAVKKIAKKQDSFNQPIKFNQPKIIKKPSSREVQNVAPIETVEKETQAEPVKTPQDWLKPKIFRGNDLV